MTSVDSNFNFLCGRPHGAGPLLPLVHMRPPEPDPCPLRVDVINGWPLFSEAPFPARENVLVDLVLHSKDF